VEQVLEILPGDLSEEQAWSYVKQRYAKQLQTMKIAGTWTVAPVMRYGVWRVSLHREEDDSLGEVPAPDAAHKEDSSH
jgi:hypothetical protein